MLGAVMRDRPDADLITKIVAVDSARSRLPVRLLGGLLTLRLLRNAGAAFSQGEQFTYVFAIGSDPGSVLRHHSPGAKGRPPSLGCGPGVAVCWRGRQPDRPAVPSPGVLRGHVVDFLELPYWAVFNVADMCITTAAVMIISCQ